MIDTTPTATAVRNSNRTMVLLLLTLVYVFNFLDRQIIGIVSPFIKAEMGFTDRELGWLKGPAFAFLYCSVAIPIAWLADRYNRVKIVAASLAVWSAFTVLTGMATSFVTMLLARIGVGIGEAGGSPPSHSIISDLYAKEERASALGVYSLGIPVGVMVAYFATAGITWLSSAGGAETVDWRLVLVALGVPGILLAGVLLLVVREPQRGQMESPAAAARLAQMEQPKLGETFRTLLSIPSWWNMCLAVALVSFGGYALSNWGIDYLVRWKPELGAPDQFSKVLVAFGILNAVAYGPGTYFGAKLADRLGRKDVRAYGWLPGVAIVIGAPALLLAFWVDSLVVHILLVGVYTLFAGFYLGPSFALAQTLAPIRMRAMSTALFFFILNMIALAGGPYIVGEISEQLMDEHGSTHSLRLAMTFLAIPYALSIVFFALTAKTLPKDWAEAEARNSGTSPTRVTAEA